MHFENKLMSGVLVKRYKRFLADVRLSSGEQVTIHCPNTGSMRNCQNPGSTIWFTASMNKNRKYPHTWQLVEVDSGVLVGINTGLANRLVLESIQGKKIEKLQGYSKVRTEVPYGRENSRIDILLESAGLRDCFIEVKNVSLGTSTGEGFFSRLGYGSWPKAFERTHVSQGIRRKSRIVFLCSTQQSRVCSACT